MIRSRILDKPRVYYTVLWDEKVSDFLLGKAYVNRVIFLKVIVEGVGYFRHIVVGHLPKAF